MLWNQGDDAHFGVPDAGQGATQISAQSDATHGLAAVGEHTTVPQPAPWPLYVGCFPSARERNFLPHSTTLPRGPITWSRPHGLTARDHGRSGAPNTCRAGNRRVGPQIGTKHARRGGTLRSGVPSRLRLGPSRRGAAFRGRVGSAGERPLIRSAAKQGLPSVLHRHGHVQIG